MLVSLLEGVLFPGDILRLPLKHHGIYQGTAALPNSVRLDIPACKLEGDGAALLAEQVAKWPWLRRLSFAENGMTTTTTTTTTTATTTTTTTSN